MYSVYFLRFNNLRSSQFVTKVLTNLLARILQGQILWISKQTLKSSALCFSTLLRYESANIPYYLLYQYFALPFIRLSKWSTPDHNSMLFQLVKIYHHIDRILYNHNQNTTSKTGFKHSKWTPYDDIRILRREHMNLALNMVHGIWLTVHKSNVTRSVVFTS